MMRLRIALVLSLVAAPAAVSTEKLPPELALIPPDAAAFVSVRYDLLTNSPLGKSPAIAELLRKPELVDQIESRLLGFPLSEVERVTVVYPTLPIPEVAEHPPLFVVTRTKKLDRAAVLTRFGARPFRSDRDEGPPPPPQRGLMWVGRDDVVFCFAGDRSMLMTTRRSAAFLLQMFAQLVDPSPDSPLEPALTAAAGKNALVAGISGTTVRTLLGAWPDKGAEFAALGEARAVTLVANLEAGFRATVTANFPDGAKAKAGKAAADGLTRWAAEALAGFGTNKQETELAALLRTAIRDAGEAKLDRTAVSQSVQINEDGFRKVAEAAARSAVVRIRDAAERMKSSNNLKQFGLAVHNSHDTFGVFPFQHRPKEQAHPGLSWRVAILPFVEQDNLYREFHLDEPWDSEHNKKLIEKMPKIYAPPPGVEAKAGQTYYRMFDGPGTMYRMKAIADVTDGTSNTLMVVEAGEPVIWTKPDELPYDPDKPLPKLGGHFPGGFNALLGDGSVRFIRKGIDEKTLRALITANGGEPVTLDKD